MLKNNMRNKKLSDDELAKLKSKYDELVRKESILMQRFHIPRFHRIKLYVDLKKLTVEILSIQHILEKHNIKT